MSETPAKTAERGHAGTVLIVVIGLVVLYVFSPFIISWCYRQGWLPDSSREVVRVVFLPLAYLCNHIPALAKFYEWFDSY